MAGDNAAIAEAMDKIARRQYESAVMNAATVANAQNIAGQRVLISGQIH